MSSLEMISSLIDTKLPGLLHPGYGYVLLVVVLAYIMFFVQVIIIMIIIITFTVFLQGGMVGKARTKYKVELPTMYSDTEVMFNCYQRVHQNTLERLPLFLGLLLVAGLFNSIIAAVLGALWLLGRVLYSVGYYSGVPKNRIYGGMVSTGLRMSHPD